MYAILVSGGKQYRVAEGDVIYVEKLDLDEGATVTFDEVITVFEGEKVRLGTPIIDGVTVTGKVIKNGKQKKVIVFTYKAKKNVRRRKGHRQAYTKVQIEKINRKD